jgi:hypothetical protein
VHAFGGAQHSGFVEEMAKLLLRPQFVLFGDSITEQSFEHGGWGAALAALYARQVLFFYLSFLSQPISSFASFLPSFVL